MLIVLGCTWPRFNKQGAFWGVISGMLSMVVLTILQLTGIFNIGQYTHMAIVGFVVTLVVAVVVALLTDPPYYGKSDYNLTRYVNVESNIILDDQDKMVLELIGLGHLYMSDITDALQKDSSISNEIIERLETNGYLVRKGLRMVGFYTYELTERGMKVIDTGDPLEDRMRKDYVNKKYIDYLNTLSKETSTDLDAFNSKYQLGSLQMSSMISHLVRRGYINEKGWYARIVEITPEGQNILSKYKDLI